MEHKMKEKYASKINHRKYGKKHDSVVLSAKEIDTAIETANTYVSAAPKLKLGNNDAGAITADQVASWIGFDENLNVTLNEQAIKACENNVVTPALEAIFESTVYMSGVGADNVNCAAAHSFYNGLTSLGGPQLYLGN